ncbi:ParB N-terminal domain-containing protein [Enterobacter hormaechei]|uniref:ParB N-terminal domain-containing protein n=1 Tax=Enterobacter TaxID=547 RepID=UPI000642B582|nr:ParB N-terminal domain-containing protein [Enterobacter bugandensis]KLR19274.1 hypothetical protein ABR26_11735 [Enterobacter bugandensis]MCM7229941.1 ParB N-terminal domain-containing protein [Enterobacter hormaechei]MCM7598148.1 ParB N-terminal domain-containing protein [Enterobacter hormaechei]
MYMDQLVCEKISIDNILLDPNNPRFWTQSNKPLVSESSFADEIKQNKARQEIDQYGIEDLYNSILRNGFLLLDRIVVRPVIGIPDKYVVVEGNRRFRSLTKLRKDIENEEVLAEDIDKAELQKLLNETNEIEVLVYHGDGGNDISWMFQGIRHISGIRAWDPAQRAKLVAEQIDGEGKKLNVVGQQFGLSARATGRLYRTYKILTQMREDEEFGGKARNDYFSLFEETLRNNTMKTWLGWSESDKCFQNINNVHRFYSWISPDEDKDNLRRINDPKQIKHAAYLIENQFYSLLDDFEQHLISIEEAKVRAESEEEKPKDWRKIMASARMLLGDLPQSALYEDSDSFLEELHKMRAIIDQRAKMVELAKQTIEDETLK